MAVLTACICRACGSHFELPASAVARGRGKFCTRQCASLPGAKHTTQRSAAERYEDHVVRRGINACWGWRGFKRRGYGRLRLPGGAAVGAHRVAYETAFGSIPAGLTVLHRCDNPERTNPRHLFLGTNADNNADRDAKGRQARGERSGKAVLTEDVVRLIRSSPEGHAALARALGCSPGAVKSVRCGRTWGHVQ